MSGNAIAREFAKRAKKNAFFSAVFATSAVSSGRVP
jgi:hypothetical protein